MFRCPNLRFSSDVVYTNLPVSGAYRGYGGIQGILAIAIVMDDLAERLGMDPVDFYLKNVIVGGMFICLFPAPLSFLIWTLSLFLHLPAYYVLIS